MRVPETLETQRPSETFAIAEEQSKDAFVASASSASLAAALSFFERFARPPRRFFFSSVPFSFLLGDGGVSLVLGAGGASFAAATTADMVRSENSFRDGAEARRGGPHAHAVRRIQERRQFQERRVASLGRL